MTFYSSIGWQDKDPPFDLGEVLWVRPDVTDDVADLMAYVPIGFSKGLMEGWVAECVAVDDLEGQPYFFPCSFMSREDPWKKIDRTCGSGLTKTGRILVVIAGGKHG